MVTALKFKHSTVKMNRWRYSTGSESRAPAPIRTSSVTDAPNDLTVLVVNASAEMAREMSVLLSKALPGCSITFAPSIELASWILSRKKIGLVISSPVLPDGGIARLKLQLSRIAEPPDLVVVGDKELRQSEVDLGSAYRIASSRAIKTGSAAAYPRIVRRESARDDAPIKALGSDIRNDINNPLQEIVTMVFVAKTAGELSSATASALTAIEGAAKNLAGVVQGIEERISNVVR